MRKRPRVVAIVQARMSSTRLPGKVLASVGGSPMLQRQIDQLRAIEGVDQLIIATSNHPTDDVLAKTFDNSGISVYRGDLHDVLARYADAARQFHADVIVRLTADCPLHTPDTVAEVLRAFLSSGADYMSNVEPYTRPDGLDVEVFTLAALDDAAKNATDLKDREHVTPYLRRSPTLNRVYFQHSPPHRSGLRWTVDTEEDLSHVRKIWERLDAIGPAPHSFSTILSAIEDSNS